MVEGSLCNDCGFGSGKDNCAKCGKWVGSLGSPAKICGNCNADECVKCHKFVGAVKHPASLCDDCGFGTKKDNCARCGGYA
ncbi:MAG: hypothetical protein ABII22_06130 [Candidatus Micrarchaeota archaeon]